MFWKILFSIFCIFFALLPTASAECTMDDFLKCDREIQSKVNQSLKIILLLCTMFCTIIFAPLKVVHITFLRSVGGVRSRDQPGGVADLPQRHHQHRGRGRLRALLLCSVSQLMSVKIIANKFWNLDKCLIDTIKIVVEPDYKQCLFVEFASKLKWKLNDQKCHPVLTGISNKPIWH